MLPLRGVAVLVVRDGRDDLALLRAHLQQQGAEVRGAAGADDVGRLVKGWMPDVIVCHAHGAGRALLTRLRAEVSRDVPVIGLTRGASESVDDGAPTDARAPSFQKQIRVPVSMFELVAAVASLAPHRASSRPPREAAQHAGARASLLARVAELAERFDIRELLRLLNGESPYRFTSLFRFDGDRLVNVWSFDREEPEADLFPSNLPIGASYCVFVRDACAPFVISDSQRDPRVLHHGRRDSVRSYCGVPLVEADGTLIGSICHFDAEVRASDPAMVDLLLDVAARLAPYVARDPCES